MAEFLVVGLSHYPPLSGVDEHMADILKWTLEDPDIPAEAKDPASWPAAMEAEWGTDDGTSAVGRHRSELLEAFGEVRSHLDEFAPDVVLIWGDDQYENFHEDVIPPFCVLAYEDMSVQPWANNHQSAAMRGRENVWGESADTSFTIKGAREIGKLLVERLLEQGFDCAYAYKGLHHEGLPHAFLNAILYLDYDRVGFPYPILPFSINCYGRRVVCHRGFLSRLGEGPPSDPPSPSPRRMFDLGQAIVRGLDTTDLRIALVASSSWSHAFLCDKTMRLYPDTPSDRRLYDALVDGDFRAWADRSLHDVEDAGQHELLNWFPLAGALEQLGRPELTWSDFIETHIFNSNKAFVVSAP